MKIRIAFLSCLVCLVILSVGYERSHAGTKVEKGPLKIGVVSIREIFEKCKRSAVYREQAIAERDSIEKELEKLLKEIEAEKAGLKTLKQGSSDHLTQTKEIMTKQASLQAQQEFYKQQIELKDQQWTEQLYKDIIEQTGKVAEQKGLDLVFENDEIELPAASPNDLMLTIRTHKLLYSRGCVNITEDVMARLDKEK